MNLKFQVIGLAATGGSLQFHSLDSPCAICRIRSSHMTHHACTKSGEGILPTHGLGRNLAASYGFRKPSLVLVS